MSLHATELLRPHHSLKVWKESLDLVEEVYRITAAFPKEEHFALAIQMRRASVSIPSYIAEGAARDSKKEFLRFLSIARGSLAELETQLQIALRLGYLQGNNTAAQLTNAVFAKLTGLMKSLRS